MYPKKSAKNFSKKIRRKACLECITKCHVNPKGENPSFQPRYKHKMPTEAKASPELLYQYCKHYSITRLEKYKDK